MQWKVGAPGVQNTVSRKEGPRGLRIDPRSRLRGGSRTEGLVEGRPDPPSLRPVVTCLARSVHLLWLL